MALDAPFSASAVLPLKCTRWIAVGGARTSKEEAQVPRRRYRPVRRRRSYFTARRRHRKDANVGLIGRAVVVVLMLSFITRYPVASILVLIGIIGIAILRRKGSTSFAPFWRKRSLGHMATLSDFYALSPGQFEDAVGDLLRSLGYRDIRRVGGAGDLAADLWCRDTEGRSVVVQCKRYGAAGNIGSPVMQSFIGMAMIHHRANRGIFVTTSYFTSAAADLGRQHGVTLIDGKELMRLSGGGSIHNARDLS